MIDKASLQADYIGKKMTMRAISEKHGVSLGTVHRLIAQAGIARRNAGRPSAITPAMRAKILAMRKRRQSSRRIADVTGISHGTVWNFLKAEGLPMFWLRRAA